MDQHLEKQVREGKAAVLFTTDPVWSGAVAKVKAMYFEIFSSSLLADQVQREKAYQMGRALADLEHELKKVIDSGLHAENELKRAIRKS